MYSTGEVLDQYISDTLTSKNSVIQMLGIDRSSFYQILKGKRLPTSSQLRTLLDILNISESEKNHIRDIYMSDKLTTHSYNSRKNILKLLETFKADSENETIQFGNPHIVYDKAKSDVFNDKSDTKSTLLSNRHEINELIKHMLFSSLSEESDRHISLFIPIQLLTKTSFFETIELISHDSRSSHITYDHIINHPLRSNMIDNDFLADLTSYIGFLISSKANIRSYYNLESICDEGSPESLYPYYIITNEALLLLGSKCETAVFTSDKVLISAYSSAFNRLLNHITPIIESIDSIEDSVVTYLRSLPDSSRSYYITYNPGISYLATDELVEAFISPELQDFYKAHFHAFQHLDYKEFITKEGLEEFMKNGVLSELGVNISSRGEDDFKYVSNLIAQRTNKNLFFIDTNVLPVSKKWTVLLVAHEKLFFVPLAKGNKYIAITDKNLVEAFTDFFENIEDDVVLCGM